MIPPRAALGLAAFLGACDDGLVSAGPEPSPPSRPSRVEAPPVEVAPAPTRSAALTSWLRDAAVTDDAFARRILYSWTPATTADRLRRDRVLFDDAKMPEGPTAYVQRLEHTAAREDASGLLANVLLGHPDLARRRYAWVRPWATRMGIVRDYGDQLVEVVLRPDAIVGKYDPSLSEPWEFRDLDERPVALARVLADPSRIGAILHVRRDADPHFREYVLCNASAIESWSLATTSIDTAIRRDVDALRELATLVPPTDWDDLRAFTVDHYAPTPTNLDAIADALVASEQHGEPTRITKRPRFRAKAAPGLVNVRRVPERFVNVI